MNRASSALRATTFPKRPATLSAAIGNG